MVVVSWFQSLVKAKKEKGGNKWKMDDKGQPLLQNGRGCVPYLQNLRNKVKGHSTLQNSCFHTQSNYTLTHTSRQY